jgi:hypothetical protein
LIRYYFKYLFSPSGEIKNQKGGEIMGKIVVHKVIKRKPGHLYYVDGEGNVCEAVMARGGKKKKAGKKTAKKTSKKKSSKKRR